MPDLSGVSTVRIPDLVTKISDLKPLDRVPIWDSDTNKTRGLDLGTLRSYVLSDGGSTIIPTQSGNTLLYIVGPADAGGTIASIPSIAGQTFSLTRDGMPLIPETDPADPNSGEFAILSGGGFKLKGPTDELYLNQRFQLTLAPSAGGSSSSGGTTTSASLVKGVKSITTNFTLTADHLNLLIQIRIGATPAALTLPDLAGIPENTIIPIEAMINNSVQCKILTQGGQYIYFRNTSINNATTQGLYMSAGELLWLLAGEDGWYVINSFGNFLEVGAPVARYKGGLNEIFADGSLLSRANYPRLWEFANTSVSIVDESVWQTASATTTGGINVAKPYRGMFSRGTTTDNFRIPDLRGMALTGLEVGADPLRFVNFPGGFQDEMVGPHTHVQRGQQAIADGGTIPALYEHTSNTTIDSPISTKVNSGTRNLVRNVGVLWYLKF